MDVEAPWDDSKIIPEKKSLVLPVILRSKPWSCLGVGYTDHTNIKEQLNLKLNLKLKIDAHGKKKVEFKPGRCVWSFSLSQAPSYEAIFMLN